MSHLKQSEFSRSYASPRCKKCYKLLLDAALQEQICGAKYCSRCACQIYQPYYLSKQPIDIIEMYCSHFIDGTVVSQFTQNYCINCGYSYDPAYDIQMRDNAKLCRNCFKYEELKYKDSLFECMSCNRIIRSLIFLANTEVTMCKDCAKTQTTIQSSIIQSRATNDRQTNKTQNGAASRINELRQQEQPSEELSIVSRFSALQVQDKEEENVSKKEHKIKIASKHSIQIKVQNFKISVRREEEPTEQCSACFSFVKKDGIMRQNQSDKICKCCYLSSNDHREFGFYRSILKNNEENERSKHLSAPKNKPSLISAFQPKTMKKSEIFDQHKQPHKKQHQKTGHAELTHKKHHLEHWQNKQLQKAKLCEVCNNKAYNIIRADKKKVCLGCYSK